MNRRDDVMRRREYLRAATLVGSASVAGCTGTFRPASKTATETQGPDTATPPPTRPGGILSGVYNGGGPPDLRALNGWLGHKPALVMVFVDAFTGEDWIERFIETRMTWLWNRGHVPLLTWQPLLSNREETPEDIEVRVANGEFDDAIETWASRLESWVHAPGTAHERRLYFRPANEMNGDWFRWSAIDGTAEEATTDTGSPSDFVRMWRRIHDIFSVYDLRETNIQWLWNPTANIDRGGVRAERYYPGDEYVDWIGLSGFNYGDTEPSTEWQDPEALFGSATRRLQALADKPFALPEIATTSYVNGQFRPRRKAEWIDRAFSFIEKHDVGMVCWYNYDDTGRWETDWAVFGGAHGTETYPTSNTVYQVYENYKQAVCQPSILNARSEYPLLLTDDEFTGEP